MNEEVFIEKIALELIKKAATALPEDVKIALEKAYGIENSELAKLQLKTILENVKMAEEMKRPICQDTGLIEFFIKLNKRFVLSKELHNAFKNAVRKATKEIPLRPNAVHPLKRINSGDNTGVGIPWIDIEFHEKEFTEITVLLKGAGSENVSSFIMLNPMDGIDAIKRLVIEKVIEAGGKPCPPIILGIGMGGLIESASKLAKKALLRPLNERNSEKEVAELEDELLKAINLTGVGPMGLGGGVTSLGVNIEYAFCHTASLPIALNFQCWAGRRATAKIYENEEVEFV
ncbi:MAG: fumarate hydratase [Candidatus Bathyarchaeia archaeon]